MVCTVFPVSSPWCLFAARLQLLVLIINFVSFIDASLSTHISIQGTQNPPLFLIFLEESVNISYFTCGSALGLQSLLRKNINLQNDLSSPPLYTWEFRPVYNLKCSTSYCVRTRTLFMEKNNFKCSYFKKTNCSI